MKNTCLRCGEFEKSHGRRADFYDLSFTEYLLLCKYCFKSLERDFGTKFIENFLKQKKEERKRVFDAELKTFASKPEKSCE